VCIGWEALDRVYIEAIYALDIYDVALDTTLDRVYIEAIYILDISSVAPDTAPDRSSREVIFLAHEVIYTLDMSGVHTRCCRVHRIFDYV
jgi:hypothetical protein